MKFKERVLKQKFIYGLRWSVTAVLIGLILLSPLQIAGNATTSTCIQCEIPQPSQANGQEFYHAIYRGVVENDLPLIPDQIASPVYQQWSSMDQIYNGLAFLQNVTALNPEATSLWSLYILPNTTQKFVQTVFKARSNDTDLWWGSLDKTVEAATILHELGVMNDTLAQLNQELNYTLSLASYYATLAPNTITVNNVTVPGWTALTLQKLLSYRVTSYLTSKTISFDDTSSNYYSSLNKAIQLGLVSMHDLQLVPLSTSILAGSNYPAIKIINGADTNQTYQYLQSSFTNSMQGQTGKILTITEPTFASQFASVLNSSLYDQKILSYGSGLQLVLNTQPNSIPDKLISEQNYKMGLIYYSNRQQVSYNVTVPNNYWSYDANGSLIYVTNNTVETKTYLQPVQGVWTDNYTFVPDQTVTRGEWVWNSSIMQEPDVYNISLSIPTVTSGHQTFSVERVQGDTITYKATLPIEKQRSFNLNVSISQLSALGEVQNGTKLDEFKLAQLYNKTTNFDGQMYYFASGVINLTLDSNGLPTGGVVTNQTMLEQMAQVPTYTFSTSYIPLKNVNYTLIATVPDIVLMKYNPIDYPGELLLSRSMDTNQSYLVNLLEGKNLNLQEQTEIFPSYEYALDTGLTTTATNVNDAGYIILQKRPVSEGFQSNVLSDVVGGALAVSTNTSVNLRLSSYSKVNNPDPAIYKEYSPLINYNYANDSFSQILHTVEEFNTFLTPNVRQEVLTNISNNLMSWAWSWYNSTNGYFRNDVKETAAVFGLYSVIQSYLSPENKFYFNDLLTGLNTTISQYTYSKLENTTSQTNVVSTTLSFSATSNEPTAFGRSLDVLDILHGLYDQYNAQYLAIYNSLLKQNQTTPFTTTQQIKDYINATWGQMHPMGNQLVQSTTIALHQQYVNTTSTAMQQDISNLAQQNAQRQVLLQDLQNNPTIQYELEQSGTNFHSVQDQMLMLQEMGMNPDLAIKAHLGTTVQDQIYNIHDGFIQILKIMNAKQSSPLAVHQPVVNMLLENVTLFGIKGIFARLALLLGIFPILYGIAFLSPKQMLFIFCLYAMISMVLEIGGQVMQNSWNLSAILPNQYTNELFGTAVQDIQNMAHDHLLNNFFAKPLRDGYTQIMNPGMVRTSTKWMSDMYVNSTTSLSGQYQQYASQLQTQRNYYNDRINSPSTTMTIGDGSWINQLSYRDWVLANYKNMQQYRISYEEGKATALVKNITSKINGSYYKTMMNHNLNLALPRY